MALSIGSTLPNGALVTLVSETREVEADFKWRFQLIALLVYFKE
jgi:hypothetical protein